MKTTQLGSSGIEVSCVGLGTNNFGWKLDLEASLRVVDAALDAGITFFDTADMYGHSGPGRLGFGPGKPGDSERFLGAALAHRRSEAVVATKVGNPMGDGVVARGSRSYVRAALEASLARLRMDCVDVVYYHRPDGVTPLEETVAALEELVTEGKARAVGCSNLSVGQLRAVGSRISVLQNRYSLLDRTDEAEVLPACLELGVGYVPFSPLAGGLLTGKYRRWAVAPAGARLAGRPVADAELARVEWLAAFAEERRRSLLELAIAALASAPAVCSVIAGATSPEQVRANAGAGGWQLTEGELEELAATAAVSTR
jgi:aryl-alcohol dehydrogenase-like predicted oxidoreductase